MILAKTIKGYGLGEAGEGRNITHQQKKLNEEELLEFRSRFDIPISDEEVGQGAVLQAARRQPGDAVPARAPRGAGRLRAQPRPTTHPKLEVPTLDDYAEFLAGSERQGDLDDDGLRAAACASCCATRRSASTSCRSCPTSRARSAWKACSAQIGIYSHVGQLYEPVDSDSLLYYKEAKDGQILEEGITEAGSMSSFIAAGTAYSTHGINMIPFFIYYSMFGFQRIGDLIWAAADMRAKGFLLGGTAGRTTLTGEGLQHQDGHSLLNAIAFPTVRAYDPATPTRSPSSCSTACKRLYEDGETASTTSRSTTKTTTCPRCPPASKKASSTACTSSRPSRSPKAAAQGATVRQRRDPARRARGPDDSRREVRHREQRLERHQLHQLRRDAHACERWNMLHPDAAAAQVVRRSRCSPATKGRSSPLSDYVRALPEQISRWVPGGLFALGTDGMGRSETREALRRHFEVDAECITLATLYQLNKQGKCDGQCVANAMKDWASIPKNNRHYTHK